MSIPEDFKYGAKTFRGVKKEFTVPVVGSVNITPQNNEMRWRIPRHRGTSMCLVDVKYTFNASVTGGVNPSYSNQIASVYDRYQTLVNSRLVDEIQTDANLFFVIQNNLIHDTDYNSTIGTIMEGYDTKANRVIYGAGYHYVTSLKNEGFINHKIKPTYKMGEIEIILKMGEGGAICENDDGAPVAPVIASPELLCTYIDSAELRNYFDSMDVVDSYVATTHYSTNIPALANQVSLTIPVNKFNNLKSILAVFRDQIDGTGKGLNAPDRLDKFENYINDINEYYFRINNTVYPRDRVDNTNRGESLRNLVEYIKGMWDVSPMNSEWLDRDFRDGNKFIMAYDLSAHHDYVSGLDTRTDNADIQIIISSKNAHPRLIQVDTYLSYDVVYVIKRDGSLQLSF